MTVSIEPCTPASLCTVELFQDGNPDFFWQRELYFDQASWNQPQTIQVRSVQDEWDQHEQPYPVVVTHASAQVSADQWPQITLSVVDDDVASVKLWPNSPLLASLQVSESGTGTVRYGFSLETAPLRAVVVTPATDGPIVVSPNSLTFTPGTAGNWPAVQWLTVSAVDDNIVNGVRSGQIRHDWSSEDSHYDSLVHVDWYSLEVSVADDDAAGVGLSESQLNITEGSSATEVYTVWLTSEPVGAVVVNVAGSVLALEIEPAQLTFDDSTWMTPQSVQVGIVDNAVDQGHLYRLRVSHIIQSSDTNYDGMAAAAVVAAVADDDVASIVTSEVRIATQEGGGVATYGVSLGSEPRSNVVVELSVETAEYGTADLLIVTPSATLNHRLAFNQVNWFHLQTVEIQAVDDVFDEAEGEVARVLHRVVQSTSADSTYANLITTVSASVGDNDIAQLPDDYELCGPGFGPTTGGTMLCLRPRFVPRANATDTTGGMAEVETRRDDFYAMVAANQHTIRCRFTLLTRFEGVGAARPEQVDVSGVLNGTVLECSSPTLGLEGSYSLQVYAGEDYGEQGWLSAPAFSSIGFETAHCLPPLSPHGGGTQLSIEVGMTAAGAAGMRMLGSAGGHHRLAPRCEVASVHTATVDDTSYRLESSFTFPATLIERDEPRPPTVHCTSPASSSISRPCQYLCGPLCDKPATERSVCQYCAPECDVLVHIRSEDYGEEIYYRVDDGDEIGSIGSFTDVFAPVHLVGQSHTLTFVDSNGGGWSGGYIEVLDAQPSRDVILPPEYITAESGSIVVPATGERQGTFSFSCAGHESYGRMPGCPTMLDTCRCRESCQMACASHHVSVSLNGQQYSANTVNFTYFDDAATTTLSPTNGPTSGGTELMVAGIGWAGTFENVTVCRFDDGVNRVHVSAHRVTLTAIWCWAPAWVTALTLTVSVALDGQQYQSSTSAFEYYEKLEVHEMLPSQVEVLDQQVQRLVEVTFGGFSTPQQVFYKFGNDNETTGLLAEIISTDSTQTSVRCVMPSCPTVLEIPLFLSVNGQQYQRAPGDFHCVPIASSSGPNIGPSGGGTSVSITGHGFVELGMLCHFGNVSVPATVHKPNGTDAGADVDSLTMVCVSPSASLLGAGHLWAVPLRISAGGPILAGALAFYYLDVAHPQQVAPRAAPIDGDPRFPSEPVDVEITLDLDLEFVQADYTVSVGLFRDGALETTSPVSVLTGNPARLRFSSQNLLLQRPGDRQLQVCSSSQRPPHRSQPLQPQPAELLCSCASNCNLDVAGFCATSSC